MSPHALQGGCHCGAIALDIELSRPPADYAPRACDCSFCRKHGAAWLSDAAGTLRLRLRGDVLRYRQGSGQAEFVACAHCAVLLLASSDIDGRTCAAINVRAIDGEPGFAPEQAASPQRLSAEDKRERWRQLWFHDVQSRTEEA